MPFEITVNPIRIDIYVHREDETTLMEKLKNLGVKIDEDTSSMQQTVDQTKEK